MMSQFEFSFALVSIIAGLALAHLMSGLTRSRKDSDGKWDIAHIGFSTATVVLLVTVWWATYRWANFEPFRYPEFILLCCYVSTFYIISVILYPAHSATVPAFSTIRHLFYPVLIFYSVTEMIVMYIRDGSFSPWYYVPMMILVIVLSGFGMFVRRNRFDEIFAIWFLFINFAWPFVARMSG